MNLFKTLLLIFTTVVPLLLFSTSVKAILYHDTISIEPRAYRMIDYFHCNFKFSRMVGITVAWVSTNRTDNVFFQSDDKSGTYSGFQLGPANLYLTDGLFTIAKYNSELRNPPSFGFYNFDLNNRNTTITFDINIICSLNEGYQEFATTEQFDILTKTDIYRKYSTS